MLHNSWDWKRYARIGIFVIVISVPLVVIMFYFLNSVHDANRLEANAEISEIKLLDFEEAEDYFRVPLPRQIQGMDSSPDTLVRSYRHKSSLGPLSPTLTNYEVLVPVADYDRLLSVIGLYEYDPDLKTCVNTKPSQWSDLSKYPLLAGSENIYECPVSMLLTNSSSFSEIVASGELVIYNVDEDQFESTLYQKDYLAEGDSLSIFTTKPNRVYQAPFSALDFLLNIAGVEEYNFKPLS